METPDRKLRRIITEIQSLYMQARTNKQTPAKKYTYYQQCCKLIDEAKTLLEGLGAEIELMTIDNSKLDFKYMQSLSDQITDGLNFDEVLSIVNKLRSMDRNRSTKATITRNVEKDVIYDEQELDFQ